MTQPDSGETSKNHCCHSGSRPDILFRVCLSIVTFACLWALYGQLVPGAPTPPHFTLVVLELVHTMWWGIALGILMLSALSAIPRRFVMAVLGSATGLSGLLRATIAGVLLDLCSHGILMVGAKLYERGASLGQVMAFLIASPWNSFSLTFILVALMGFPLTILFVLLSMLIAVFTGAIFHRLVSAGVLPENSRSLEVDSQFRFFPEAVRGIKSVDWSTGFVLATLTNGLKESRMVMRWILFGILLASCIRAWVDLELFQHFFGPTLLGLSATLVAATVIEVCSEGSTPIAADLVNRAKAPGNGFAFLMAGVSTDYTEIIVLKQTTRSLKTALYLPLLTVPQILAVAWILNQDLL